MFLDYFALFLLFFIAVVLFYSIIVIHDIPYEIAVKRNHPHQDAIHVAGWVSLFTLHVLWPFLWIWATLWREERGWGFVKLEDEQKDMQHRLQLLSEKVVSLERELVSLHDVSRGGSGSAMDKSAQDESMPNEPGSADPDPMASESGEKD